MLITTTDVDAMNQLHIWAQPENHLTPVELTCRELVYFRVREAMEFHENKYGRVLYNQSLNQSLQYFRKRGRVEQVERGLWRYIREPDNVIVSRIPDSDVWTVDGIPFTPNAAALEKRLHAYRVVRGMYDRHDMKQNHIRSFIKDMRTAKDAGVTFYHSIECIPDFTGRDVETGKPMLFRHRNANNKRVSIIKTMVQAMILGRSNSRTNTYAYVDPIW